MAISVISIIVLLVLIFMGLVFLMQHFMKGTVRGELSHLDKLNEELLKREAELKQKMIQSDQEYSTKMAQLEKDLLARQTAAKQEASKLLEQGRESALKEREKIVGEAISTRDKIRSEIMAEMETKAIEYSRSILAQFFAGDLKKMLNEHLIRQLLEGIRNINVDRFQIQSDTAELKVAEPLTEAERETIRKALSSHFNREVKFNESIDPSLVGGVKLQFGSFVIDGTMSNMLQEAAVRLRSESKRKYQSVTQ